VSGGEEPMMDGERLVDGVGAVEEQAYERSLRPKVLEEYVGQRRIKSNLSVFIKAARQRAEPLDHVLLYGPPGLGKTTLACVIAREMEAEIRVTSGPAIEVIGSGPGARTVRLELPRFTLVGATTRFGLLSPPLRDRFGIVHHLDYYSEDELALIAGRSSSILGIELEKGGASEIARRARGTQRVANRLLRRVRDFVQVEGGTSIDEAAAMSALERLEVDQFGLDEIDRKILTTIVEKFDGGPVGLATLAASVGEDPGTVEEIYEPYLLQIGFLDRTPRGRRSTRRASQHLKGRDPSQLF